jgi:hypothetical protein
MKLSSRKTGSTLSSSKTKGQAPAAPAAPAKLILFVRRPAGPGDPPERGILAAARIWEKVTPVSIYRYLKFRDGEKVHNIYLGSVRKSNGADDNF